MNPGTLSIVILALFGFGLTGAVAWLRHGSRKQPQRQDESPS